MRTITLVRGLPGSGKSTFSEYLESFSDRMVICSADDYFTDMETGEYNFDGSKLKEAHSACKHKAEYAMQMGDDVIVANTNTQAWEMKPYEELAEKYGYRIFHIVVENRHGNKNVHGVPDEVLEKMRNRFEISL